MKKISLLLISLLMTLGMSAATVNLASTATLTQNGVSRSTDLSNWYAGPFASSDAAVTTFIYTLAKPSTLSDVQIMFRDRVAEQVELSAYAADDTELFSKAYTITAEDLNTYINGATPYVIMPNVKNVAKVQIVIKGNVNPVSETDYWQTLSSIQLLDNEAVAELEVGTVDANGFVTITGTLTTELKAKMNDVLADANVIVYDMRGVTVDAAFNTALVPANPNALFLFDNASNAGNLPTLNGKNVVRIDGGAWYNALAPIVYDDEYPFFSTGYGINHINTNSVGYTFTRTIAAGKYATVALPGFTEVPEGLKVYSPTAFADNTLTFTEVETATANTPYVVYAESEATIEITGTGDFVWQTDAKTEVGNVAFVKANQDIVGDGSQYAFQGATAAALSLKAVNGGKIKAGRAYFTLASGAKDVKIAYNNGQATAIKTVAARNAEGKIYNLQGIEQTAGKLQKGIYIINGKKVVVK